MEKERLEKEGFEKEILDMEGLKGFVLANLRNKTPFTMTPAVTLNYEKL